MKDQKLKVLRMFGSIYKEKDGDIKVLLTEENVNIFKITLIQHIFEERKEEIMRYRLRTILICATIIMTVTIVLNILVQQAFLDGVKNNTSEGSNSQPERRRQDISTTETRKVWHPFTANMLKDDFTLFYKSYKNADDELINHHMYKYILKNDLACSADDLFLVILVHSAPKNHEERAAIRQTYGSIRFHSGVSIVTLFVLGMLEKREENSEVVQKAILKESRRYMDIIQGDFVDHYRNLTYKHVMLLDWVTRFCNHTKFVVKTDDDTMVDPFHLIEFLLLKSPDGQISNFLYCSAFHNQGPVRRPDDKWFVSYSEYPYKKYPTYCEGFAYITSTDVVHKLLNASKEVPFYWIDDVYVTGFLPHKIGLKHRNMEPRHSYNVMLVEHLSENVKSSIFLLAKYPSQRDFWNQAWSDILTHSANR
ncbi:hypothetical protein CHS0354_002367 [Potamilus streckersoni]|uniref:Hexosyltransferase n=1 Tax=Potamilus streckersoni TaxID=2493646 RepID=A0AAE0SND4_9BIVA|nr:hypothetical protein CHS0354_002367 [Potamilus streckersoni]